MHEYGESFGHDNNPLVTGERVGFSHSSSQATMSSYDRYNTRQRRPLYAPSSNSRRSTLGYWVPLVLTVTVATAGLIAWIWSERQEGDDDDDESTTDEHDKPEYPPRPIPRNEGDPVAPGVGSFDAPPPSYPGSASASRSAAAEEEGFFSRVSGAVRRSPSPQQFFDNAGSRLVAGVAAAGAAVGLGSIKEEHSRARDREEGFSDHERWNEEAESKRVEAAQVGPKSSGKQKARRTVAIVVSAEPLLDSLHDEDNAEYRTEHASILSHLPQHFDPSTTRLFVLIYAPHLISLPTQPSSHRAPASTLSSSYSVISTPAQTPAEEVTSISPTMRPASPANPPNRLFDALWTQALALVDKQSMVLPFTTPTGYVHILRHLSPSLVYLSDNPAISGLKGDHVAQLRGWVGQTIVVVGDEGHGGLADTESEDENAPFGKRDSWWEGSDMVGLGKGVEVVDAGRVGDDWARRLGSRQ